MSVAVCATVKNEVADARALIEGLLSQRFPADEIVIVDGGSTDGTLDTLRACAAIDSRIVVRSAPGTNIAAGRNLAIKSTRAALVAVTDAGIQRSPFWLEGLVAALDSEPLAAGSFGYILASPSTTFEAALGAVVLPLAHDIDEKNYPPSSGSALFRRSWIDRIGGYPEWLAHGEDLWLDRAIWRAGGWFCHASEADVGIRPRSTVSAFARQYFQYAAGDGHAGMLVHRHIVRFGAYGLGVVLFSLPSAAAKVLLGVLVCGYLWRVLRRAPVMIQRTASAKPILAVVLMPILRIVGDVSKMAGFVAGYCRRL